MTTQAEKANMSSVDNPQALLKLKLDKALERPPSGDVSQDQTAATSRRIARRDAQAILSEDAFFREHQQATINANVALGLKTVEAAAALNALEAERETKTFWIAGTGLGALGTMFAGALWLRARRTQVASAEFKSSLAAIDSELPDDSQELQRRANHAALLGDSSAAPLSVGTGQANVQWQTASDASPPDDTSLGYNSDWVQSEGAISESSIASPQFTSVSFSDTFMAPQSTGGLIENDSGKILPDVQWVPQPMQDLLLLNRGLVDWEAAGRWGVAEQAIRHHIDCHKATSAWVYLELLRILRHTEQRPAFDEIANSFRTRFNRLAPTWMEAQAVGKDLLRYDLATMQLTQAWSNNSVIWLLEEWLVGEPHMRRLMDAPAFREVLFLYELSLEVNDNPYSPRAKPSRYDAAKDSIQ